MFFIRIAASDVHTFSTGMEGQSEISGIRGTLLAPKLTWTEGSFMISGGPL
jgi:hypothetical protein